MEGSDTEALKLLTLDGHLGDDLLGDFWQAVYFASYTKMHFLKIKLYSLQPAELRQCTLKLQQELVLALFKDNIQPHESFILFPDCYIAKLMMTVITSDY